MAKFIMLSGIAGSGKSVVAGMFEGTIHSAKNVKAELGEDTPDSEVFETLEKRILADVAAGKDCIYNAQNLHAEERTAFLQKVRSCSPDTQCICVVVQASLTNLLQEYDDKHEYIPIKALRQMAGDYEAPSYFEGWDTIMTIQR